MSLLFKMARVESSIEGPLEQVENDSIGAYIKSLGVKIQSRFSGSNHSPKVTTPTRSLIPLTVAQALDPIVFSVRTEPKFAGGAVLAIGTFNTCVIRLR